MRSPRPMRMPRARSSGAVPIIIMIETVFDTLNAKAAIYAIEEVFAEMGERLPVWISGTITDLSGRTLTGQTVEAFWHSVRHAAPFAVGLNCALGPKELRPYVADLAETAQTLVSAHPNAGLPNAFGGYDETPESMSAYMREFAARVWSTSSVAAAARRLSTSAPSPKWLLVFHREKFRRSHGTCVSRAWKPSRSRRNRIS